MKKKISLYKNYIVTRIFKIETGVSVMGVKKEGSQVAQGSPHKD